ncbi:hypothetical protein ICL16_38445 [Iningainema sp. BLCCT55]|uniref:Uncharacterized protein n=1 Tax=Iningainema tapete BLCC-T55 TaxID=2748662 RepID=A0A8J6XSW4_9CYAN|nr:hypothetical protein [Iningainema tapete BLCC-T55]
MATIERDRDSIDVKVQQLTSLQQEKIRENNERENSETLADEPAHFCCFTWLESTIA